MPRPARDSRQPAGAGGGAGPAGRERSRAAFERICTHVALAHGCVAEVEVEAGYPATINDPRAVALIRRLAGDAYVEAPAPSMGGEDFAYVLERIPGAMACLGVAPHEGDPLARAPLHNPAMMVDEAAMPRGVALHCAFATTFLAQGYSI